jgi:5-formyltetrahydrofolate cyclo-ligase
MNRGNVRAIATYPPVPVVTTVHGLQILAGFPTEAHDLPVSLIATPDELISTR